MKYILFILVILITIFSACGPDDPPDPVDDKPRVKILGHKGSGSSWIHEEFLENTIPSITNAIKSFDGVEVDVQMSKDGTPWLYHDRAINGNTCDSTILICIPQSTDYQISSLQICYDDKKDRVYTLQKLLQLFGFSTEKFYISLDVKSHFFDDCFLNGRPPDSYFYQMADTIISLIDFYDAHSYVLIESDKDLFLDYIENVDSNVLTCRLGYSGIYYNLEKVRSHNYDGISMKFTDETLVTEIVDSARKAGVIIQLWTPYSSDDIRKAIKLKPSFIQVDRVFDLEDFDLTYE
ncbi:MAG: glycerophosphodiester phosphodiesterase [Bacteroidota bacterium]|nr:glycerophosphodiester phosphodiesterase [Bacteroidota bacterium]